MLRKRARRRAPLKGAPAFCATALKKQFGSVFFVWGLCARAFSSGRWGFLCSCAVHKKTARNFMLLTVFFLEHALFTHSAV